MGLLKYVKTSSVKHIPVITRESVTRNTDAELTVLWEAVKDSVPATLESPRTLVLLERLARAGKNSTVPEYVKPEREQLSTDTLALINWLNRRSFI